MLDAGRALTIWKHEIGKELKDLIEHVKDLTDLGPRRWRVPLISGSGIVPPI